MMADEGDIEVEVDNNVLGIVLAPTPAPTLEQLKTASYAAFNKLVQAYIATRRSLVPGGGRLDFEGDLRARLEAGVSDPTEEQFMRRQLEAAERLRALSQEIKYHPYMLRTAPPVSRPAEREAYLEAMFQKTTDPIVYENARMNPPLDPHVDQEMDMPFYFAQDWKIRHGPFGRRYHEFLTKGTV